MEGGEGGGIERERGKEREGGREREGRRKGEGGRRNGGGERTDGEGVEELGKEDRKECGERRRK